MMPKGDLKPLEIATPNQAARYNENKVGRPAKTGKLLAQRQMNKHVMLTDYQCRWSASQV
jgi:hypothetical protein